MPARSIRLALFAALALALGPPALAQPIGAGPPGQMSAGPCSGHGHIEIGRCFCDSRWTGPECAAPEPPPDCGAHGKPVHDRCACDAGWKGHACRTAVAPACPHGKLATGECA